MNSSAGNAQIFEAGDQRNWKEENVQKKRFEAGQPNAHSNLDAKDQRSLANRLAAAEKEDAESERQRAHADPLAPARAHGNEPSRGAKIDAEIQADEEEELKRKGKLND